MHYKGASFMRDKGACANGPPTDIRCTLNESVDPWS